MGKKVDVRLNKEQLKMAKGLLLKAIKEAGTQSKFANMVGVHQPNVSLWLKGERILPEKALEIERLFRIDRRILRPDLFGELEPEKQSATIESTEDQDEPAVSPERVKVKSPKDTRKAIKVQKDDPHSRQSGAV